MTYLYTQTTNAVVMFEKVIVSHPNNQVSNDFLQFIQTDLKSFRDVKANLVPEERINEVKRYVVSGPEQFVEKIMKNTNEPLKRFKFV